MDSSVECDPEITMKCILFLALLLTGVSCSKKQVIKNNPILTKEGKYVFMDSLEFDIQVSNNMVHYNLTSHRGKELFGSKDHHEFSDLHKWAFYLDKQSIWILSRDIGYAVYTYDSIKNDFCYRELPFKVSKNEVPQYLYERLPSFFD